MRHYITAAVALMSVVITRDSKHNELSPALLSYLSKFVGFHDFGLFQALGEAKSEAANICPARGQACHME